MAKARQLQVTRKGVVIVKKKVRLIPWIVLACVLPVCCAAPGDSTNSDQDSKQTAVEAVLDDFHDAKSKRDCERCMGCFASDAVIFGTDRTERFSLEAYRAFIEPYFSKGVRPVSKITERNVFLCGNAAWFDERQEWENMGELRGSGVLLERNGCWKIVQYNLAFPVPNELVRELTKMVDALTAEKDRPAATPSKKARRAGRDEERAVEAVLDDLHRAASEADGERYFKHLAPDTLFYGTDKTERWNIEEFKAYVEPYFSRGTGWTAVPIERNVFVSPDGKTAWFDESLKNTSYCETRGTGVLLERDGGWKIVQYNLAFPIPNELVPDLVDMISEYEGKE